MPATIILSAGATPLMIRTRLTRGVPSVTGCTVALFWASTFQTYGPSAPRVMARAGTNTPLGAGIPVTCARSEEHTSELQSLMRLSYAVFCLKNKTQYDTV